MSNPANKEPYQQAYYPPLPTGFTRAMRTFVPWQVVRFVVINLKMLKLISCRSNACSTSLFFGIHKPGSMSEHRHQ